MTSEFKGNTWSRYPEYDKGFEVGQKSKHAEIDLACKSGYQDGFNSRQAEIDTLQKCIDTALWHLEDHGGYEYLTHVIKILKGVANHE